LLGGSVRGEVEVADYILPTQELERPEDFVKEGKRLTSEYGFRVLKLKAGVFHPSHDVDVVKEMSAALPNVRFRLDPNGAWSLSDALWIAKELSGSKIEYFEDPGDVGV